MCAYEWDFCVHQERDAQNKSGAAPSTWPWHEEMNALLAHRLVTLAKKYGVDSEADEDWDGVAVCEKLSTKIYVPLRLPGM